MKAKGPTRIALLVSTLMALASLRASGTRDPFIEILYFQYGRYLTLASSRGMALPSNLQGIWNNSNTPPWSCDYHSNINVQMNYWTTDTTSPAECFTPYSDYLYNQAIKFDGASEYRGPLAAAAAARAGAQHVEAGSLWRHRHDSFNLFSEPGRSTRSGWSG